MTSLAEHIVDSLQKHELTLDDAALKRVVIWATEAQRHGRHSNLIGMVEDRRIAEELVADSLCVLPLLPSGISGLVDIGAGSGIPGLILAGATGAAARLVEPRAKRAMFLKHAARSMGLGATTRVFESRLEAVQPNDLAMEGARLWVSRAVFSPERWLEVAAEHGKSGDFVALWCNGHVNAESLQVPAELTWIQDRRYSIRGPGDRTIFVFSHKST